MRLLFNIALIFSFTGLLAQESMYSVPVDSVEKNKRYIPTGIRIGADILGPILYQFDKKLSSYELTIDTDIDKYNLVAEVGYQNFTDNSELVNYDVTGYFVRIGPETNFIHMNKDLNSLFFGLRYAWSGFDETVVGNVEDDVWGTVPIDLVSRNRSRWLEVNTGLRIRLWRGIFTGYSLRVRFARRGALPDTDFSPYYVPGYGLSQYSSNWNFRYYILYRFQWSKKPIMTKRKEEKRSTETSSNEQNNN